MLLDAFSRALRRDRPMRSWYAKDDSAVRFYQRYRFRSLIEGRQRLFVPMAEIAKLFS